MPEKSRSLENLTSFRVRDIQSSTGVEVAMRRSARLSRQSETADLPVVDENSAFVANVKTDQSPRVSTES